jgi:hypothetical protein
VNEVFDNLCFHRKEATFVRFKKSMFKGENNSWVREGTVEAREGVE